MSSLATALVIMLVASVACISSRSDSLASRSMDSLCLLRASSDWMSRASPGRRVSSSSLWCLCMRDALSLRAWLAWQLYARYLCSRDARPSACTTIGYLIYKPGSCFV